MTIRNAIAEHMNEHFVDVDLARLGQLGEHRKGKVRDLFISDKEMLMVTTDRLSAFDVVLTSVPCKGAILNAIAIDAFEKTEDICPNHLIDSPHPNVMRVKRAVPLPIEIIVRRYITGSLWRDYEKGTHVVYEVAIPEGLKRDQQLPGLIITPSTKAEVGLHDEPISK